MDKQFHQQLDSVIKETDQFLLNWKKAQQFDLATFAAMQTRCVAAIERASGPNSRYLAKALEYQDEKNTAVVCLELQIGAARGLLHDINNGYLSSIEELIHGDVFADYLAMADQLVSSGYKDPSAVLAGSTLEAHLRALCTKYQVTTMSNGKAKSANRMNEELTQKGAYHKQDLKNVTAWLGIRNFAAHGEYGSYTKAEVQILISSVRDFIIRNPA